MKKNKFKKLAQEVIESEIKSLKDKTPVTNGDIEVNKIILENLKKLTPNIPIVSEETAENKNLNLAYPDTVVGTDSHTTMINGLSVLGWGVGGIEAEAAMLGQPISMVVPEVIGFEI